MLFGKKVLVVPLHLVLPRIDACICGLCLIRCFLTVGLSRDLNLVHISRQINGDVYDNTVGLIPILVLRLVGKVRCYLRLTPIKFSYLSKVETTLEFFNSSII